jgi:hypothetical protein
MHEEGVLIAVALFCRHQSNQLPEHIP